MLALDAPQPQGDSTAALSDATNLLPATTAATETAKTKKKKPVDAAAAAAATATRDDAHRHLLRKAKSVSKPTKRERIPGRLKRLAVPHPTASSSRTNQHPSGSTKPDVNRRGNKVNKGWGTGGFLSTADLGTMFADAAQPGIQHDAKGKGRAKDGGEVNEKKEMKVAAELWITRKTSYPAYLKSGVAAFVEKG